MQRMLLAVVLMLALAPCRAGSEGILWFSDVAPRRAKAEGGHEKSGRHAENMDAVISGDAGDNLHSGVKRLWLRRGDDPASAPYVDADGLPAVIDLMDARGQRSQVAQAPMAGLAHAKAEFEALGFRNAYLARHTVADGVLRVQLAKAELLKGSCCMKGGDVDPAQQKPISDPAQPLEIVREHAPDEKLFTRIVSGDEVVFTVRRLGQPLAGAPVTMLTQAGWQKKAVTDAEGRVAFTLIRDYFPHWSDFKRRTKETFVVVAEAEAPEAGARDGQPYAKVRYQATLSGRYAPSPHDYKSYAWGLGISVFVAAFGGLAVYLYRRRRVKPFQEVRFDESA